MERERSVEILVGLFMLAGVVGLLILALKVSGLTHYVKQSTFSVSADFDNIGALKVRAPVNLAGVKIGEVTNITLDNELFKAHVTLRLDAKQNKIPLDSSASILTEGLLGVNYISVTPGFDEKDFLKDGSTIEETNPALILENLVGKLLFNLKGDKKDESKQ